MAKKKKTADEIIEEIAEVLGEASGELIETIANQVLTHKVIYLGDSMFKQDAKR